MNQSNQSDMEEIGNRIKARIEKIVLGEAADGDTFYMPDEEVKEILKIIKEEYGYNLSQPSTVGDDVVYVPTNEKTDYFLCKEAESVALKPVAHYLNSTYKQLHCLKPVPLSSLIPARVSEEVVDEAINFLDLLFRGTALTSPTYEKGRQLQEKLFRVWHNTESLPKHSDSKKQEPK